MIKQKSAFTLVEVLIASTVLVVLMVTVYAAFRSGHFGYRAVEENLQSYQTARQVLERITSELKNSFHFSKEKTGFFGGKEEIRFFSLVDSFSQGEILKNYAYLSYKLEGDKLLRLCRKNKEALNENSEIAFEEFAWQIKEIIFNYAEINPSDNSLLWKEEWSDTKALPVAIKIKLTLNNDPREEFTRTVYLAL